MADTVMDRMCCLLQNLSTADDIYPNLLALKTELNALDDSQLQYVVNGVNFTPVFQCLTRPNSDQVDVCCGVLEKLMTAVSDEAILMSFSNELLQGLDHTNTNVQLLCIRVLKRLSINHHQQLTSESSKFTYKLVGLLASSDLQVAGLASEILSVIGQDDEGLDVLYSGETFETLQNVMRLNDTVRYRVLQLALDISRVSSSALTRTSQAGLLQSIVTDLHKNDVLVQLNCIELLTDLALTPHGLAYLHSEGVVGVFLEALHTARSDPLMAIILPSLVKFFGNIARFQPKQAFTQYPYFVELLFEEVASEDASLSGLAIETVGFIGSSPDGKMVLSKLGDKMDACMHSLSRLMISSQSLVQLKVLAAVSSLFSLQVCEQTSELLSVTQHWYSRLGPSTLTRLMEFSRQPFPDVRAATHSVFAALALLPWGQRQILDYPGFREYLLDRTTENDKPGKEGKFEIVRTLVESPTIAHNAGNPYLIKLRAMCNEGPFYVVGQAEVAYEQMS